MFAFVLHIQLCTAVVCKLPSQKNVKLMPSNIWPVSIYLIVRLQNLGVLRRRYWHLLEFHSVPSTTPYIVFMHSTVPPYLHISMEWAIIYQWLFCVDTRINHFTIHYIWINLMPQCSQRLHQIKPISPLTGLYLSGLSSLWREKKQPNITCRAPYYDDTPMTFIWVLARRNGDLITLPAYSRPSTDVFRSWTQVIYKSTLNYTLSTDDIQSILRCIVRMEDKIQGGSYEAMNEKPIPSYSMCNDTVSE